MTFFCTFFYTTFYCFLLFIDFCGIIFFFIVCLCCKWVYETFLWCFLMRCFFSYFFSFLRSFLLFPGLLISVKTLSSFGFFPISTIEKTIIIYIIFKSIQYKNHIKSSKELFELHSFLFLSMRAILLANSGISIIIYSSSLSHSAWELNALGKASLGWQTAQLPPTLSFCMHEEQQLMIFLTLIAYNLEDKSMKSFRKTLIEISLIIILKQLW